MGNYGIARRLSVQGHDADGEPVEARCQPRGDQVPTGIAVGGIVARGIRCIIEGLPFPIQHSLPSIR